KSASDHLYSDIKLAHSEAIKKQIDMHVSFQTGANWCYGIDDASSCDCNTANDCTVDGNEYVVNSSNFNDVSISLTALNSSGGISFFTLEGNRGTVDVTGSVIFSVNGKSITVNVTKMGHPT